MAMETPFGSLDELESTYYGEGGGDGGGGDDGSDPYTPPAPEPGSPWSEPTAMMELQQGWTLFSQQHQTRGASRWFLIRLYQNQPQALTKNATARNIGRTTPYSEYPLFSTQQAARAAYEEWLAANSNGNDSPNPDDPNDENPEGDGPNDSPNDQWGEPDRVEDLRGGWILFRQPHVDRDAFRWFLFRQHDGGYQVLNQSAQPETIQSDTLISNYPLFTSEETARAAYQTWLDSNPDADPPGEGDDGDDDDTEGEQWSDWSKLRQIDPWWIFGRQHETEDRSQFMASSMRDGEAIYLAPEGQIQTEAHIYDSVGALRSALSAYFEDVQNGEIPPEDRPSGEAPPVGTVTEDAKEAGKNNASGPLDGLVSFARNNPLKIAGAIAAAGYVATQSRGAGGDQ